VLVKVVIMTIGSQGDVAPFLGLGVGLQGAHHDVTIATQDSFAAVVREHGLGFRALPGNTREVMASDEGRRWTRAGGGLRAMRAQAQIYKTFMRELAEPVTAAADGADVLLLQAVPATHGYLVGKAMGIPSILLGLTPSVPTEEFLPAMFGGRSLGRRGNRTLMRLGPMALKSLDGVIEDLQTGLGLPPTGMAAVRREMFFDNTDLPILDGYSPAISPRPADWRPGVDVVGYWWPPRPPRWEPPAELVAFLEAGPPPVFIGFGSHGQGEAERIQEIVAAATRRARVRAVVQSGWAGLSAPGDDVLAIGNVPHDWLFPRMAAVVHHAGAGTTGAGLRAGVPAVPVPILADQPFWAARLARLGVSPGSVRFKRLSADRLAGLIQKAVSEPAYRRQAAAVAERVSAEDGAARVLGTLQHGAP
jgi:UDP:flavonoid glycosyltransferase YjiC (YdhE family)